MSISLTQELFHNFQVLFARLEVDIIALCSLLSGLIRRMRMA